MTTKPCHARLERHKGETVRLEGRIQRFSHCPTHIGLRRLTLVVDQLRFASTGQRTNPDHVWIILRENVAQLNLQPGDEVAFTVKIHRLHKGYQGNEPSLKEKSPMRTAYGPGREVKDLTVLKRAQQDNLAKVVSAQQALLNRNQEISEDNERLIKLFDALELENDKLKNQIILQKQELIKSSKIERDSESQKMHLIQTIGQIEQKIQTMIPRQRLNAVVFSSLVFGIFIGLSLGGAANSVRR